MGNGCLTKYQLKTGCLELQVDTKNDGLDNASLFKRGYFGYPCWFWGVYSKLIQTCDDHFFSLGSLGFRHAQLYVPQPSNDAVVKKPPASKLCMSKWLHLSLVFQNPPDTL